MGFLDTHLIGEPVRLRIGVAAVATGIGVSGIVLEGLIPQATNEILNIELLVLPLVYIVGNELMEDVIKKKNEENLFEMRTVYEQMKRKNAQDLLKLRDAFEQMARRKSATGMEMIKRKKRGRG